MIYKDPCSGDDTDEYPSNRWSPCVNCTYEWGKHNGWKCPDKSGVVSDTHGYFDSTKTYNRYLTESMRDSIADCLGSPKPIQKKEEEDDWRFFLNNKEGECFCGTNKSVCKYH